MRHYQCQLFSILAYIAIKEISIFKFIIRNAYKITFLYHYVENLLNNKWVARLKVIILLLVVIAIITEILPEMEAKLIVIPTLILVLILGIIEIRNRSSF
jgi:hypothetical protein